ncbi:MULTISPECIES: peptide chain release factor aRF-1 [Methanobacterium]|jgi:peptide chain release factor subunit 1|uniref:Peptide chain release factor subunit 1 n=1 Tax=Methanobacterium subterraneum TaxID=59277 RepID=A0A2H4VT91_9EURY|nr:MULTISPECIES: peptide chain release factor aRF-1 [Methanobacterium]MBW4256840.1 peptide chain release factor aRF-1 [Methanobacterium sp. YSL]AUB54818.1 peptide chain release factor 1 [Methanobacterium subterraneum]AUB58195.1 peptide chain release factor 1 [Methanobacterium sp. MZ-A1]AUB61329.1 peptide chain release factor 1 [Methanobacterium subterraneum]MCC7560417.1 peptide chain release factor aRF-1 [Methanobacterium sp.]
MSEPSSTELYEVKRTLKELSDKKGRGTELVSVYIPPNKQISDVVKHMREELSQSANIKSKQTKKNVQSAIEVIMQRMRLFPKPPERGLVLFVGMIPKGGPGTEKMETYVFEPPEPVQTYTYHCDSQFFLEPLQEILEDKEIYGLAVVDRKEATIAIMKGKRVDIVKTLTSGVPGKHKAGGQSQRRFDRLIELAAHEFLKRIGEHMNEAFLELEGLKGIIIGGPGHTKEDFINGDYLHHEIKQKIITTVDTSYTGDFGIREVIDKSMDVLTEIDIMREKKLVQRFLTELVDENGLASYGEAEVRQNLINGAVEVLLLSEDIKSKRYTFQCHSCGNQVEKTIKNEGEVKDKSCENCGETMKVSSSEDVIGDFVTLAEEVGSEVEIISTETEEGMQLLRAFGGIGAILRYRV